MRAAVITVPDTRCHALADSARIAVAISDAIALATHALGYDLRRMRARATAAAFAIVIAFAVGFAYFERAKDDFEGAL